MSFDWNPFKVTTIVKQDDGTFKWHCDSCGAGWRYSGYTSLDELWKEWERHIRSSHKMKPKQTKDWSSP